MADQPDIKKTAPFSIRLTAEERACLEAAAFDVPLGTYIRARLLDGDIAVRRTRGKRPVRDYQALGELLGKLGQSNIAGNLHELASAARTGSLPVTPDTEAQIQNACSQVAEMRSALLTALGLSKGAE